MLARYKSVGLAWLGQHVGWVNTSVNALVRSTSQSVVCSPYSCILSITPDSLGRGGPTDSQSWSQVQITSNYWIWVNLKTTPDH